VSTPSPAETDDLDPDAVETAYDAVTTLIGTMQDTLHNKTGLDEDAARTWSESTADEPAPTVLAEALGWVRQLRAETAHAEQALLAAATSGPQPTLPGISPITTDGLTPAQVTAQAVLDTLRAVADLLRTSPIDHTLAARIEGQLGLHDAVLLAQALHHVADHLPYLAQGLLTVLDPAGREITPQGAVQADTAARALYHASERMMRDLDPNYGPHAPKQGEQDQ
jgi:hypothetical protein